MEPRAGASFAGLVLALAVRGQEPAPIEGVVLAPDGRPVAGAEVHFRAAAILPIGVAAPPAESSERTDAATRSDADGRFRLRPGCSRGALWVSNATLGALVPEVASGDALRVELEPLGSLRLADGDPLTLDLSALHGQGGPLYLGRRAGPEVLLPGGPYLFLARSSGDAWEGRVYVRAGQRELLPGPEGRETIVRVPPGTTVRLERWPEVALPAAAAGVRIPAGAGRVLRVTTTTPQGLHHHFVDLPAAAARFEVVTTPPLWRALRVLAPGQRPAAGAWLASVEWLAAGPRVRAWSPVSADGLAHLLVPATSAPVRGLVWHPTLGAALCPTDAPAGSEVRLAGAWPLRVEVRDPRGTPLAAVRLRVHAEAAALDWTGRTDLRGSASFGAVPTGRIRIYVADARYIADAQTLEHGRERPTPVLVVAAGLSVHGLVILPEGRPAAHARVALRDSAQAGAGGERHTFADELGRFRFDGLADAQFTLFASFQREAFTWSAKLRGVQPGETEWRIDLRHEDPPPPGTRRDR
ncbi:MAG: carboxypeptidase regulatory-like domain-containing protein [Planctomycetes bacterium]|nr:carboxypeptidase regulatory-like domain-containing protein [Planctomycetota bacterium]